MTGGTRPARSPAMARAKIGTVELEYEVPANSDAVKEVVKCLDYCKQALA